MAILVTGGTKGIGRAIALGFAESDSDVFLNYAADDAASPEAEFIQGQVIFVNGGHFLAA